MDGEAGFRLIDVTPAGGPDVFIAEVPHRYEERAIRFIEGFVEARDSSLRIEAGGGLDPEKGMAIFFRTGSTPHIFRVGSETDTLIEQLSCLLTRLGPTNRYIDHITDLSILVGEMVRRVRDINAKREAGS